jgi:hypothetical protein
MENTPDRIIFYLPSSIWLKYGLVKFKPYIFFPNIKMQENKLNNLYFDRFNNTLLRIPFQIIYDKYYHRLDLK